MEDATHAPWWNYSPKLDGLFDPADYGIVYEPPTPTMIYLGIRYAVWTVLAVGLIIAGAHMAATPTGCYFPPCY